MSSLPPTIPRMDDTEARMKRTRLTRRTPFKRGKGSRVTRTPMKRSKKRRGPVKGAKAKQEERWSRNFRSVERVLFIRDLPCACGGVGEAWGCPGGPCQNSHDPSRGAGGSYLDISPLTFECHRELEKGAKTFWLKIGKTREASNAETHAKWLGVAPVGEVG